MNVMNDKYNLELLKNKQKKKINRSKPMISVGNSIVKAFTYSPLYLSTSILYRKRNNMVYSL